MSEATALPTRSQPMPRSPAMTDQQTSRTNTEAPPWEHPYEAEDDSMACRHCGWVGSYAHTVEFYQKWVFPALAAEPRSDAVTAPDEPSTEAGKAMIRDCTVWGIDPSLAAERVVRIEQQARAASASVSPPLAFEIRSVAAAMLRGEHTCDRRHKSEHVHLDDVHRWGQRLAFALNAAETPEQGRGDESR